MSYRQPVAAFVRLTRWLRYRCLVCGHKISLVHAKPSVHYRYCSCECSMYDGTMAARTDVKTKPSRILTGKATEKYYIKENSN